jgi:hypothetical protein
MCFERFAARTTALLLVHVSEVEGNHDGGSVVVYIRTNDGCGGARHERVHA